MEPMAERRMEEQQLVFAEEGGLGITFCTHAAEDESLVVVMQILPDSLAAQHEELVPGMVLSSVQGAPVPDASDFKATMTLIRAAGRPLVLGFAMVQTATNDWTPRLVPLARPARQDKCPPSPTQLSAAGDDGEASKATVDQDPKEDDFGFSIGGCCSPTRSSPSLLPCLPASLSPSFPPSFPPSRPLFHSLFLSLSD